MDALAPQEQPRKQNNVQVKAKDEVIAGSYANVVQISHTKEEFLLDFMSIFPPVGTLNDRVIVSPGHLKRMIRALQENVIKYEKQHGPIAEAEGPKFEHGFPVR